MASFSGSNDFDMECAQRNPFHQNDDTVRGHSGVIQISTEGTSGRSSRSSSIISTTLKRKPSRNSFLAWVAFDRKYDVNISDIQRRTCPLIGCERDFKDPELMLQHVYDCLPGSKGLYRCFECRHEERIGKYHAKGCKELHQSKERSGGFAKVANSLRLAKRLFSRHASKNRPQSLQPHDTAQPEADELAFETEYSPSELETNWFGNPVELSGIGCLAELGAFDKSMYMSADQIFQRGTLSELSSGNDTIPTPVSYIEPHYDAAELEACSDPTFAAKESHRPRRQAPAWRPDLNNDEGKQLGHTPFDSRLVPLTIHGIYQGQRKVPPNTVAPEIYRWMTVDDIVSPMSPTACDHQYDSTPASLLAGSNPSKDSGSTTSTFSTVSSISTRDNSMSSFDLSHTSVKDYHSPTKPFLEEFGSDMMYSEPEELEPSSISGNGNYEPVSSESQPWYITPNSLAFGNNIVSLTHWPSNAMTQQMEDISQSQCYPTPPYLPSPSNDHSPQPPIITSPRLKRRCVCGFEPSGKEQNKHSNLKRHQKTCKKCTGNHYPYICNYPHCGLRYNRSDNLLAHQRLKKHSKDFEMHFIPVSPPLLELEGVAFDLQGWEVQPKRRRTNRVMRREE